MLLTEVSIMEILRFDCVADAWVTPTGPLPEELFPFMSAVSQQDQYYMSPQYWVAKLKVERAMPTLIGLNDPPNSKPILYGPNSIRFRHGFGIYTPLAVRPLI